MVGLNLFAVAVIIAISYCCGEEGVNEFCPSLKGKHELFPLLNVPMEQQQLLTSVNHCEMEWTNRDHIRNKFQDRLRKGEKQFFRLRLPTVFNGTIIHYVTVVWVNSHNQYMLHFPQNFQTLSLGAMTIISENLKNNHISWQCPPNCSVCGMGRRTLSEFLSNLTSDNHKYYWKYLCIPASYGMEHILDDYPQSWSGFSLLNSRDFAFPDTLYYLYFFKMLFISRRSPLGVPTYKEDFPNYYCYNMESKCVVKELLMKYYILVYTAFGIWLYMPLLVYYLPSSATPRDRHPQGMIPTHQSPVYFSHYIQVMLGYHLKDHSQMSWWKIRLRRFMALIFLYLVSIRFLTMAEFRASSWLVFVGLSIAALFPRYLSKSITTEVPKCFPLFPNQPYPKGLIKWNTDKEQTIEFQRLAYIMQERILLVLDLKFWLFVVSNSFILLVNQSNGVFFVLRAMVSLILGVCTLLAAVLIALVYFLVPILFFARKYCCLY